MSDPGVEFIDVGETGDAVQLGAVERMPTRLRGLRRVSSAPIAISASLTGADGLFRSIFDHRWGRTRTGSQGTVAFKCRVEDCAVKDARLQAPRFRLPSCLLLLFMQRVHL